MNLGSFLVFLSFLLSMHSALGQSTPVIQSTFDASDEGWTQVNISSDFRYVVAVEGSDCSDAPPIDVSAGVLTFCDPDAGDWMFQAPSKFLGSWSNFYGGQLHYRLRHVSPDRGDYPENVAANVVVASGDTALVYLNPIDPTLDDWHQISLKLDDTAGWLWVDDESPMEDLPLATSTQIRQVFQSVTAFRILGEFITGSDRGYLDDVKISSPQKTELPSLTIRQMQSGKVEITWPATNGAFRLESAASLDPQSTWSFVDTGNQTRYETNASAPARFFRLRQP